ncbi:MAG TPA: SAM-dependent methyltransferase, partial [Corynebacterium sp.]|nr:SAM-dependent methyltransferase [Corynebacterium sp.]
MSMVPQTSQPGQVVFVGAGPGNPELLTVRAREVLAATSIAVTDPGVLNGVREVVASALPVPQERLDAAEAEYERICAEAKEAGARRRPPRPPAPTAADIREVISARPDEIVAQLRDALAEDDGDVIRLVTGNPLTRDSTMAEIAAVAAAGMEFQVVPGMSLP